MKNVSSFLQCSLCKLIFFFFFNFSFFYALHSTCRFFFLFFLFFVLHLRYGLNFYLRYPYVLKGTRVSSTVWILRLTIDRTARIIRGLLATCEETVNETTNFSVSLMRPSDQRFRSMIARNYIIDIFTVF